MIFGPSGTGKTVLLRLIAGVDEPDDGRHPRSTARDVTGVAPEQRGVGMAFQNFALFPHMSALREHRQPAASARRCAEAEIKAGVDARRQAAARSTMCSATRRASCRTARSSAPPSPARWSRRPSVLLLDDPLRNVDAKLRFEMRLELPRLLRQLRLDGALRDPGLQGGDGAGRPHRRAAPTARSCRSATPEDDLSRAGDRRSRAPVRRSRRST